uniref:G_PROTEIN_RECEP_F1_2 domain-containing protein n=1 Tax=Meloidogyne hapla TaxID=6305 RepID=A0A1I8BCB6_MELHA
MCATGDLLQPEISQETLATANIYNLLTVACYVTIWILMIIRKESSSNNRRLIKSLTAIIIINLAGYINTQVWLMLLPILSFNAVNVDSFVVIPALLMYVAASGSNTPVLFAFSKDYNRAFKNTFKHLFCGNPLKETIISTSTIGNIRTSNMRDIKLKRMNMSTIVEPTRYV